MPGTREIKRRIKAVKSTAQVTRAMQLVAASKMKHAQQMAVNSRPYAQLLAQFFAAMNLETDLLRENPLFMKRGVTTRGILIISPDKGLCGGLLTNLNREILKLPQDAVYVAVGKRASQTIARLGRKLLAEFVLSDKPRFAELKAACEMLIAAYEKREVDTFEVLYTDYISPVKQLPTLETILPIADFDSVLKSFPKDYVAPAPMPDDRRPLIVEPSPGEILSQLLPLYIKKEIFRSALEAKASEHSARMVAMKNATDNANELNARLTLTYNKARQAAITNEILELAAGAAGNN
jgi:F-type H+-transporting ATPase subunit gamma